MAPYELTSIWQQTMLPKSGEPDSVTTSKENLRAEYARFWAKAVELSRQINKDLPNLTLHDERHLAALWETADLLLGRDCVLTPLEAFLLGGAILLHDSANSVAAYDGLAQTSKNVPGGKNAGSGDNRMAAIEATPEWRDARAEWLKDVDDQNGLELGAEGQRTVLFETLRALHARRAEEMARFEVETANGRSHLIEDGQIRTHLGQLIGQIAASHHWNLSKVATMTPIRGALGGMPGSWTVRPVLLACLLRCADAAQLDQERAPDFLYGLLRLRGVSEAHWRAQNRLNKPVIDPGDPRAIRFTSSIAFEPDDAQAWWVAFDAIHLANRELQACDGLLRDKGLPPLAINRVRGAESPERLAEDVQTVGWRPVKADVRVTNVAKIVDLFGGSKLYGDVPSVPLRELIQNSADAITFRRELEPGFEGRIVVGLEEAGDGSGDFWLSVEDDGLGMSEAVLTGPLIDFGGSYMSSALVKAERPGLLSKGRKRIGKFGVGFFSIFMVSDNVDVVSRPFDQGLDACRTLRFSNGIVTHPMLLEEGTENFDMRTSTRVKARLSATLVKSLLSVNPGGRSWVGKDVGVTLEQLVGALCPMLDADVCVQRDGKLAPIHSRRWHEEDRLQWLRRARLPLARDEGAQPHRSAELAEAAGLLRFIDPEDPKLGLAAITGGSGCGIETVGGLRSTYVQFADSWVGVIDHHPSDPRRSGGNKRPTASQLATWASEQARLVVEAKIPFPQKQHAALAVARFGGNASPIVGMRMKGSYLALDDVVNKLIESSCVYFPIKQTEMGKISNHTLKSTFGEHAIIGLISTASVVNITFNEENVIMSDNVIIAIDNDDKFYDVDGEFCFDNNTIFSYISDILSRRRYRMSFEKLDEFLIGNYVYNLPENPEIPKGIPINCCVLKVWVTKQ